MRKALGFFLVCTFLLGAGTIYASGNAGQNLFDWYKNSLLKKSDELGTANTTGIASTIEEIHAFLEESKMNIDDKLTIFQSDKVIEAKSSIEEYQAKTINSLNDTVTEIGKVNFDAYVEGLDIEAEIDQDFEEIMEEVFGD